MRRASSISGVTALSLGNAFQAGALFQALIRQYGGSLTDEAGATATYNSEAGVQALEKIKELRDKYTPDIAGSGDPEKNSAFFRAAEASFGSYDIWKADFVGIGKMRGVGWAICYLDPATGGISNHWITLHETGNVSGPHLHVEAFAPGGARINPADWFRARGFGPFR